MIDIIRVDIIPFSSAGCRAGNGDKLSSTQAEPGQSINSAVAYFPSISCATSCPVALYCASPKANFRMRVGERARENEAEMKNFTTFGIKWGKSGGRHNNGETPCLLFVLPNPFDTDSLRETVDLSV